MRQPWQNYIVWIAPVYSHQTIIIVAAGTMDSCPHGVIERKQFSNNGARIQIEIVAAHRCSAHWVYHVQRCS